MMNKKRLLAVGLAATLSFTSLPIHIVGMRDVFAEEVTENFIIDENGVLQKYNGAGGDVVIPDGVTGIGEFAFNFCTGLSSVTIPEGMTEIGDCAFHECNELTDVMIPESVTSIGKDVFKGTKWLKDKQKENPLVIVNNIVIDGMKCVGDVEISKCVTIINDSSFSTGSGFSSLTSVTIPEGVTKIGDDAFSNCNELKNITIPKGVTEIGDNAFLDSDLTTIKGKNGSYAQKYANENGYKFEEIEGGAKIFLKKLMVLLHLLC